MTTRKRPLSRQQQLAILPDEYLWCRIAHPWEVDVGYGAKHKGTDWPQWTWVRLYCPRCDTKVERIYDVGLDRITSTSKYPPDYLLKGVGRGNGQRDALAALLMRAVGPAPTRPSSRRRRPRTPKRGSSPFPQGIGAVAARVTPIRGRRDAAGQ